MEQLVFDILKCDPKTAHVRELESIPDRVADLLEAITKVQSKDDLTVLWRKAKQAELLNVGVADGPTIQEAIMERVQELDMDAAREAEEQLAAS